MKLVGLLISAIVLLTGSCRPVVASACTDDRATTPAVECEKKSGVDRADAARLLDRVAFVGASASSGFSVRLDVEDENGQARRIMLSLADVFAASVVDPAIAVHSSSSSMFFLSPTSVGRQLLEQALATEPTLIVGIDLLFWFGYGRIDQDGRPFDPARSESQRMELLEHGLKMLDRVQCPVIIGDFPDMEPAVGRMISRAQMPRPETLERLNKRLHEWASERPHVTVLPLSQFISDVRSGREMELAGYHWPAGRISGLIQRDELHPTALGLVAITHGIIECVADLEGGALPDLFRMEPEQVLETAGRRKIERMMEYAGQGSQ